VSTPERVIQGVARREETALAESKLPGQKTGSTAVKVLMAALGACMTGTFAAQATARWVRIESLVHYNA
jgi:hypothetical protein